MKICGLTRREDLEACAALGVDALGINLWPRSRRGLSLAQARALLESAPQAAGGAGGPGDDGGAGEVGILLPLRVGVFVDQPLAFVEEAVATLGLGAIQPHGDAPPRGYAELAARLGIPWIWVVRGTPALTELELPTPAPAWILLDAAVPGYGGEGRRTDWAWAARAVEALAPIPVWLAGGIAPDNVDEALAQVRPAGIDVASGAELPGARRGEKDRAAIAALVEACRRS
nr:phosphoribosylanthranilate isomerase [Pseudenhygromyxa sp. WMMC2535]